MPNLNLSVPLAQAQSPASWRGWTGTKIQAGAQVGPCTTAVLGENHTGSMPLLPPGTQADQVWAQPIGVPLVDATWADCHQLSHSPV